VAAEAMVPHDNTGIGTDSTGKTREGSWRPLTRQVRCQIAAVEFKAQRRSPCWQSFKFVMTDGWWRAVPPRRSLWSTRTRPAPRC